MLYKHDNNPVGGGYVGNVSKDNNGSGGDDNKDNKDDSNNNDNKDKDNNNNNKDNNDSNNDNNKDDDSGGNGTGAPRNDEGGGTEGRGGMSRQEAERLLDMVQIEEDKTASDKADRDKEGRGIWVKDIKNW